MRHAAASSQPHLGREGGKKSSHRFGNNQGVFNRRRAPREDALSSLTLGDSSVCEHQEKQDPRRGAHPHQAASPASYSTSLSTFAHDKRRVKRINTKKKTPRSTAGELRNPPFPFHHKGLLINQTSLKKIKNKNNQKRSCGYRLQSRCLSESASGGAGEAVRRREVVETTTGSLHSCERHCCLATELCSSLSVRSLLLHSLRLRREREMPPPSGYNTRLSIPPALPAKVLFPSCSIL